MNLREHVMEAVSAVEVTVPAGELLELLDERDALKDRVSSLEFRLGFRASDSPMPATIEARADGSIEGGWDIQDGDEMVTVEVPPPVGDCSCKAPVLPDIKVHGFAKVCAENLERAVCGSRQPPSQDAEMAAPLPALKEKSFVSDKGAGKPSETVVPWKASYTPNQCRLALQIFAEGHHGVTVASQARVTKQTAHDIGKAYATQIEHMAEMGDKEREHFLDSLYRQMLARWVAAGKDPAVQPELPVPTKTLSEAAKPDKPSKGKAGNL